MPGSKRCGYTVHAPMRTCNSHSASAPPGRGSTISGSSSSCCLLSLHCSLLSTLWLLLNLSVFLRVPFILRLQLLHQLRSMRALATYLRNMTCPAGDGVHPWSGLHSHMAPWSLHRSWKQRSVLKASSHRAFIATSTRQQSRVQHGWRQYSAVLAYGPSIRSRTAAYRQRCVKRDDSLQDSAQSGIPQTSTEMSMGRPDHLLLTRLCRCQHVSLEPRLPATGTITLARLTAPRRGCQLNVYTRVPYLSKVVNVTCRHLNNTR